jgi:molybdenum cofactor cytidylyltransferase
MAADTTLYDAFALAPAGELVAFVGGGGKTTLMFALARELAAAGRRTVVTTTTRLGSGQVHLAPALCHPAELVGPDRDALSRHLDRHRLCLIAGTIVEDKAKGVALDLPGRLLARPDVDDVLVEADGAQELPVKAPAAHEPALPLQTTLLVPVAGIDALEGPIIAVAHRPELVSRIVKRPRSQPLRPLDLALLLVHSQGGLKDAPADARVVPFINKVESERQLASAQEAAFLAMRHARVDRVIIGAAQQAQPVRDVIT